MVFNKKTDNTSKGIRLIFGFMLGLYIGSWGTGDFNSCSRRACKDCPWPHEIYDGASKHLDGESKRNATTGFIFIGIMTAKKYLDTRAVAVYNTWRKSINGKVVFFSSEGSVAPPGIPMVGLVGTDDAYPPQKKSFSLLKYIHDNYLDDFEWFMRVDDDAFIKGDKLEKLLRSIDSSKRQFMGQPGMGTVSEFGRLSLSPNENFCMGGPGIVFSRSTLKALIPYLGTCLRNMYTTHEDVEIGRCVRKFVGIPCTWAFENHKEDKGSFKDTLTSRETRNAITLHPIKEPVQQYRVYTYFLATQIRELQQKCITLQQEINQLDEILQITSTEGVSKKLGVEASLHAIVPENGDYVTHWEYFQNAVYLYTHRQSNPVRGLEWSFREQINIITENVVAIFNTQSRKWGRELVFKKLLYGYKRVNALIGPEYILDILMTYRKFRGKKMSVDVRKHVYIHQSFADVEFSDDIPHTVPYPFGPLLFHQEFITFILPLAGRFKMFRRFLSNYEAEVLNKGERAILLIILHHSDKDPGDYKHSVGLIEEVQRRHGYTRLRYKEVPGPFIRSRALRLGAAPWNDNSLLFFIDVDILFKHEALYRIRENTKQGLLVYFPIVFSQYDPKTVCHRTSPCNVDPYEFNSDAGYWRRVGFGMLGIYKSDLRSIGDYDISIIGWGKEDVDIYQKTVKSNLTLFRSVDPAMSHLFHRMECDPNLPQDQYIMCTGAKYSKYGSAEYLARRLYNNPNYADIKSHVNTP